MTILQFFITYAVCWWMVLFMVLPYRANPPAKPGPGHAASAPANPMIRKKIMWASGLSFIPAILFYILANDAHAEDMYHASSKGCKTSATYRAPADIKARDGYGTGDKKVESATIGGDSKLLGSLDKVSIGLNIPSANYLNPSKADATKSPYHADMSRSDIGMGTIAIGQDGSAALNGEAIAIQDAPSSDCAPETK